MTLPWGESRKGDGQLVCPVRIMNRWMRIAAVAALVLMNGGAVWGDAAKAEATLGAPTDFMAPDWVKQRPELLPLFQGVKVYRDIEYVPGASKIPLTNPGALDPEALKYIQAGGKTRAFDLYVPEKVSEKMPLVVYFHGGPNRGTKEGWVPALILLTQGYVVASANYRLRGEGPFPATVNDGKAVIRWMRAHAAEYHIDPDHIGVWGHSAGAMLVDWLGAANDVPSLEGDEGNLDFSSHVQAACAWSGGVSPMEGDNPNPLKYIDAKKTAPFLLMHGDKDPVVPISKDTTLAAGLVSAGVECSFIPVKGGGHGIGGPMLEKQVIAFFDRYLKPEPAAGVTEQKDLAH